MYFAHSIGSRSQANWQRLDEHLNEVANLASRFAAAFGTANAAILTGGLYPLTLLSTVLMRLRSDKEVNALRVAMLKAVLVRNSKLEVPVAFDPDNSAKGYLLGRLFAVYEHVQSAALGRNVNATIKDKFYGSASTQPRKVFALLDRGSAAHLCKVGKQVAGYRISLEKLIGEIMNRMSPGDDLGRVKTVRPRDTGDAKLNLACYRNCELESTWFARSAVSDLVAPMRTPHVWIAAMRGFTPRMFMTRVRL